MSWGLAARPRCSVSRRVVGSCQQFGSLCRGPVRVTWERALWPDTGVTEKLNVSADGLERWEWVRESVEADLAIRMGRRMAATWVGSLLL